VRKIVEEVKDVGSTREKEREKERDGGKKGRRREIDSTCIN